jgi:hypothetical protein
MIRNHLLASQVLNTDWIHDSPEPDTDDVKYSKLSEHAHGGFCFGSPCDYMSHLEDPSPVANDLVNGAAQGMVDALRFAITETGSDVYVNLLLGHTSPQRTVRSSLPNSGRIEIDLHKNARVFLRVPAWVRVDDVTVSANDQVQQTRVDGPHLALETHGAGAKIVVRFPMTKRQTEEQIDGRNYTIHWTGDTVLSVKGPDDPIVAMYPCP